MLSYLEKLDRETKVGDAVLINGEVHLIKQIDIFPDRTEYTVSIMSTISYAVDVIQQMYLPPEDASLPQKMLAVALNNRYRSAMYWIAYERLGIGSLNRYPLNCSYVRRERPFANLLIAYLELCKGCHEFARKSYPNDPIIHWAELISEFKKAFIDDAIEDKEKPDIALKDWLKLQTQIYKQLEDRKNPFSDSQPLYFNLMECACHLAEYNKKFDVKYWVPFLNSYRDYYQHCDEVGSGVLFVSDGRLWQTAQGKPKPCKILKSATDVKDTELAKYYCLEELKRKRGKDFEL